MNVDIENGKWVIACGVRDTERLKTIPGARAARKTEPGLAIWRVAATLAAAKQMKTTRPEAEWSPAARAERKKLTAARKARLAAADGWIPVPMLSMMDAYETTTLEDLSTVRAVRQDVPSLESQAEVLLEYLQGREPDTRGATEAGTEGAAQTAGARAGQTIGQTLYVQEAVREARA